VTAGQAAPRPMMTVPFGWRRFFVSITHGGDVNDWCELPLERLSQRKQPAVVGRR